MAIEIMSLIPDHEDETVASIIRQHHALWRRRWAERASLAEVDDSLHAVFAWWLPDALLRSQGVGRARAHRRTR
jgi:hypothetical protein